MNKSFTVYPTREENNKCSICGKELKVIYKREGKNYCKDHYLVENKK